MNLGFWLQEGSPTLKGASYLVPDRRETTISSIFSGSEHRIDELHLLFHTQVDLRVKYNFKYAHSLSYEPGGIQSKKGNC